MTTQPVAEPEAPVTTPHEATAFPTEHLYRKSPAETKAAVLAGFDEVGEAYDREQKTTVTQYEQLTGQYQAPATGVTGTGSQRVFTGGAAPKNLDMLNSWGALGETTAWATGNAVKLGDGSWAKWDGAKWVVTLPMAWNGHSFSDWPGVDATTPPASSGAGRLMANPTTAWPAGDKITVNGFPFTWSGTAWIPFVAPAPPPDAADEQETPVETEVTVTPKKPSSAKK